MTRTTAAILAAVTVVGIAGCAPKGDVTIEVVGTDDACTPATDTADAGDITFDFVNQSSQVNELYVLRDDGSIVAEVENVTTDTRRELTVSLSAGTYTLTCKPGQAGDGFSSTIEISGDGGDAAPTDGVGVEVVGTEYEFGFVGEPSFAVGTTYTFEFVNQGTMQHEMEVFGPDGDALGEVPPTAAGEEGKVTITLAEAGTYRLVCGIDGHEANGMVLEFTAA